MEARNARNHWEPPRRRPLGSETMTRATLTTTLVLLLAGSLLLTSCGRDASDAGAKLIGVGFDPGTVQPAPIPSAGLVDLVNLNYEATNLDLGATGLYYPGDPFVDGTEPFQLVMGFSYVFHPALTAADELQLLSPKGPDVLNTCYVTKNRSGPIGSFTTVDMGDALRFQGSSMRWGIPRTPGDYPGNTADVFLYYIGSEPLVMGHPDIDSNWAYDEVLSLQWDGGVPPKDAPVASVPMPSWAEDQRTGKAAGDPTIYSPPRLEGITVAATEAETGGAPLAFAATTEYAPSPFAGAGDVINVRWEPWDQAADNNAYVVLQVRLLYDEEGGAKLSCPWDPTQSCDCEEDGAADLDCDPGYVADPSQGNNEGDGSGVDNCSDGIDNDGDFYCDADGCICANTDLDGDGEEDFTCPDWMQGRWLGPDPECARHYKTSVCREGSCHSVGGDRNPDAVAGELTCTVSDEEGNFIIPADQVTELMGIADMSRVAGAFLIVSRTSEERITLPMVKDEIGKPVDVGETRVRVSNITLGRLAVNEL